MIVSTLTTKAQTTLPKPVRDALGVGPGDRLTYRIEGERVILGKAPAPPQAAGPIDDPFATFGEWDGTADHEAYAGL